MNIRMATLEDVDTLIKARLNYFAAGKWELIMMISTQLQGCYPEHLNRDFFAAFAEGDYKKLLLQLF